MKKCSSCRKIKQLRSFCKNSTTKDGFCYACKDCMNAYKRKARQEKRGCYANEYADNRESAQRRNKKYTARLKLAVFQAYSEKTEPSCSKCGFSDERALSIDHMDGGGNQHRKEIGMGRSFYKWLIDNEFPPRFQILCMNCQFIKRHEENEHRRMTSEIAPYRKR